MKSPNTAYSGFKSGFVTIIGAPNVGKSTLLNHMLGEKISITSKKPQTTRNRILGILHTTDYQVVFIDTPGVHQAKNPLNERIVEVALTALGEADLILFLVDATRSKAGDEEILLDALKQQKRPVILGLNKIDLVTSNDVMKALDKWHRIFKFKEIVPVSAKAGTQVPMLLNVMESALPEGPPFFPEDMITDMPERFFAAEIVREKAFRITGQEIPYAVAVTIDSFTEDDTKNLIKIFASIHVERNSQKGIIIGKGGQKLKQIGEAARKDLERFLGTKVFLKLFVRVQKNWRKDTKALRRFGY